MSHAKNYFAWQGRLVNREIGRRVIEVGCGVGNFTGMLLDREAVIALDKEPHCIEQLQQRYPDQPNLRAFTCDAEALGERHAELAAFGADSCVCLNVLEHIGDDAKALRDMASILAPGGVIVLLVPAFPALYGPIDKNLGHHRRYTRDSIAQLAEASGAAREKGALHELRRLLRLVDECPHPETRSPVGKADRRIRQPGAGIYRDSKKSRHPPFGQSLFVVLQKPC